MSAIGSCSVLGCCDPFEEYFCLGGCKSKEVNESLCKVIFIATFSLVCFGVALLQKRVLDGKIVTKMPLRMHKIAFYIYATFSALSALFLVAFSANARYGNGSSRY